MCPTWIIPAAAFFSLTPQAFCGSIFQTPSSWCCLLAKEMIAAYPDCQDIRCDDEDKAPAPVLKTTYATTQAPVIMDPEAQKYMTDLQALPVDRAMASPTKFEGDIMGIDPDEKLTDVGSTLQANFIKNEQKLWRNGVVPYEVSLRFRPVDKQSVRSAMEALQRQTCVRFQPKTELDKAHLAIVPAFGCSSFVGRQGDRQFIFLQTSGCMGTGYIQHELLHSLGLYHEQSRSDRDDYVDINWDNLSEKNRLQFQKYTNAEVTSFGLPYDYESLMHYGSHEFAQNPGEYTIRPKPGTGNGVETGQRLAPSSLDIKKINLGYCRPKGGSCPKLAGWMESKTKCYFFSFTLDPNLKLSFVQARNYCRNLDSNIANPSSEKAFAFIKSAMIRSKIEDTAKTWVGSCRAVSSQGSANEDEESCEPEYHFACARPLQIEEPSAH